MQLFFSVAVRYDFVDAPEKQGGHSENAGEHDNPSGGAHGVSLVCEVSIWFQRLTAI